jgi:hypothetical protein
MSRPDPKHSEGSSTGENGNFIAAALVIGLCVAQLLAFLQVYRSNHHLHQALVRILDAGFLAVPNNHVIPSLQQLWPAFCGGLFFTFTLGLGLTLLTCFFVWMWDYLLNRRIFLLILFLLTLLACLAGINAAGVNLLSSLYFLVIPAIVGMVVHLGRPQNNSGRHSWKKTAIFLLPVMLLAFLWIPRLDEQFFVNFRDNVLLTNVLGRRINDFYYRYTLYPAQVFKSLDQKTLRTCHLEDTVSGPAGRLVAGSLLRHDYLPVDGTRDADLEVGFVSNDTLLFKHIGREVMRLPLSEFLARPAPALQKFSDEIDRFLFFRQIVFLSLLLCAGVVVFLAVYLPIRLLCGLFLKKEQAPVAASWLSCLLGVGLYVFIVQSQAAQPEPAIDISSLSIADRREQVLALRAVAAKNLEIGEQRPAYQPLLHDSSVPVRYWLARALGESRMPATIDDLLVLLNDPQPNVVCMAFFSLGRRGDRRVIPIMLEKMRQSDHWYEQWYGYRALKNLGWTQESTRQ